MRKYLLSFAILFNGCAGLTPAIPAEPVLQAQGFNEHYAHQQRDGSIYWFTQDRDYYPNLVKTAAQKSMTEDEWKATLKDYHYEVLVNSTQENK